MLDVWRQYAATVTGRGLPCDHYLPEQAPAQTTAALLAFPACL
jgi:haloacetate dehalogenase